MTVDIRKREEVIKIIQLFYIPNSQFPIPNSQFPIPNSQFPIPNSQFPIPNSHESDYLAARRLLESTRPSFPSSPRSTSNLGLGRCTDR
ncbi:MAG: hypothetical protein EAZ39_29600 [Oscillatoriales cyanobacterium]|nr:MAG: hypothetical protein EAZ39_29600 [Oscillatoriales cyanobacterium]TAG36733.1 MAG: hypothetical protein EAZ33_23365 [Oscillatoriales cyanobacterium]TAG55064.1 MAG: hypothetical protein EAZ28_23505 [Oscillatoriales cyanobacterium]